MIKHYHHFMMIKYNTIDPQEIKYKFPRGYLELKAKVYKMEEYESYRLKALVAGMDLKQFLTYLK